MISETFDEREAIVTKLKQAFGSPCKVNLVYQDGSTEGVWAVFCDEKSKKNYNSKYKNREVHMRLVNTPLGWANALWGMEIIAHTKGGEFRLEAYEKENYDRYLKEYKEENEGRKV